MSSTKSGIALVTVVVTVILISIIAIAAINLMAGQALLIEHQIRRLQAYYIAEAASQKNLISLLWNSTIESSTAIGTNSVDVSLQAGSGPLGTSSLSSVYTY
jgi:type II secretory pathway component PulK